MHQRAALLIPCLALAVLAGCSSKPSSQTPAGAANYPHLVQYGPNNMIAAWASTLTGAMTGQVLDASTAATVGARFPIGVPGHPYQSFKAYSDGSVAYASVGSSGSTIQIARVMPCQ